MDWDALWHQNRSDLLSRGPSARARLRVVMRLVRDHARRNGSFVDVGCGTGMLVKEASGTGLFRHLVGVDISDVPLRDARAQCPGCDFIVADICAAPLRDPYDLITCLVTLDLVPDPESAAGHLAATLAPGGHLIVVVQHLEKYRTELDDRYGVRRFTRASLCALFQPHGLDPVRTFSWGFPLYNLYYSAMTRSGAGVVGARSVPTAGLELGSLALSAAFRLDDLFTWSERGRVLFGVFKKPG